MATPEQIIGNDALTQLAFEGYAVTELQPPLTVAALRSHIAKLEAALTDVLEVWEPTRDEYRPDAKGDRAFASARRMG